MEPRNPLETSFRDVQWLQVGVALTQNASAWLSSSSAFSSTSLLQERLLWITSDCLASTTPTITSKNKPECKMLMHLSQSWSCNRCLRRFIENLIIWSCLGFTRVSSMCWWSRTSLNRTAFFWFGSTTEPDNDPVGRGLVFCCLSSDLHDSPSCSSDLLLYYWGRDLSSTWSFLSYQFSLGNFSLFSFPSSFSPLILIPKVLWKGK